MGQYSMNAYDADIYLRQFRGLISNGNDPDGNLEYAVEAENVDTTDGFLQPAADPVTVYTDAGHQTSLDAMFLDVDNDPYWQEYFSDMTEEQKQTLIEKLLMYFTGDTKKITAEGYKSNFRGLAKFRLSPRELNCESYSEIDHVDVYIFSCGRGLMVVSDVPGELPSYLSSFRQCRILNTAGIIDENGDYTANSDLYEDWRSEYINPNTAEENKYDLHWSCVNYQGHRTYDNESLEQAQGPGGAIHDSSSFGGAEYYFADDALYISCKQKGLYCIQMFTKYTSGVLSSTPVFNVECYNIRTPVKFEHIEAFGERLWGCAGSKENDSLYYSTPYNPFNWKQNADQPADGAGEIQEPNWDGDYFTGMKAFGNSLIAFKTHRAWKVNGVDLGTMVITEQYGFGTEFIETAVTSGERIYFADRNGLAIFDGSTVRPMMRDNLRNLWSKIRQSAMGEMRGFLYENRKYCLAVPVDSDKNNTLIVYDTIDSAVFYYENMNIRAFVHPIISQNPTVMWDYGSSSGMKKFDFNAWEKDLSGTRATRWMTPWIELGRKDIQKGGHDLYMTPEVRGENPVTFTLTIQTEKKIKTKAYTVQPMTEEQITAGKQGKTKRLHFGGTGRRFRLIIETPAGEALKWRLYGGIHLITEIDKD